MADPVGHKRPKGELDGDARRTFVRALINDLHSVERMLQEGMFERGVSRIGAEQEMFLVDRAYHPAPAALKILERLKDKHFTTELGLYNLEMNADPQQFAGAGLARMEAQLVALYDKVRAAADSIDVEPVLVGILPTLSKTDLGLHNMVPAPRYQMLNRAMNAERGEAYDFSIRGLDELVVKHDTVMVESCNASFQAHLQLAEPERFPQMYNLAQMLMAPILAASPNSPMLFGRRLWAETRIALFEQSCDIRSPGLHLRNSLGRVSFGRDWLRGSVVDLYKENLARFRALVGSELNEDSMAELDAGRIPHLAALRLHNGTIYRWNRACYDISPSGKPHLRIELRILPSGPTIADEVANTAFWLGLMSELGATIDDVADRLDFDHARANLYNAARDGVAARFTWLEGEEVLAQPLILERLLPLSKAGLDRAGVNPNDSSRYLSIIEKRVRSLHTGSRWMLQSLAGMGNEGTTGSRAAALVAATIARQKTDQVVSDWELARLDENDATRSADHRVSQHMSSDLVTARPDDPIRLVAKIFAWEKLRHIPVEDDRGRLVGLISARAVERHLAANPNGGDSAVADLMRTELVTVTPDTPTLKAIALARKHKISCLPVVQGDHLVALLNRDHFVGPMAKVLEQEERAASVEFTPPLEQRELGRIVGLLPGPTVIVVAGMHGNEPAGIHAVRRVLDRLRSSDVPIRGELLVLAGNLAALKLGVRYQRRDLNRVWNEARVAEVRAMVPEARDEEDREQVELLDAIEGAVARARGPLHLADCHTSSAAGIPFMIFGDTALQRKFVRTFPIPILVGLEAHVAGVLSQYFTKRGMVTFAVEGGGHLDPRSVDALEAVIWQTLATSEQVSGLPELAKANALLEQRRAGLPRVIEVTSRRAITTEDQFVMEPGFRNIDHAREGQLLARDVRGEIRAPHDGLVVMPLYQGLGNDGYFWGREILDDER